MTSAAAPHRHTLACKSHKKWDNYNHHRYNHIERVEHEALPRHVIHERHPAIVRLAPVCQAPAYSQPVDPGLSFNSSLSLR